MTIAFFQSKGILPNLQGLALEEERTRYQLQLRNWDYIGWSDTKFVKPDQFNSLIDLPRFYETMQQTEPPSPVANPEASLLAQQQNQPFKEFSNEDNYKH